MGRSRRTVNYRHLTRGAKVQGRTHSCNCVSRVVVPCALKCLCHVPIIVQKYQLCCHTVLLCSCAPFGNCRAHDSMKRMIVAYHAFEVFHHRPAGWCLPEVPCLHSQCCDVKFRVIVKVHLRKCGCSSRIGLNWTNIVMNRTVEREMRRRISSTSDVGFRHCTAGK